MSAGKLYEINMTKNNFLKVTEERSRIRNWIRIPGSATKCHGSPTLIGTPGDEPVGWLDVVVADLVEDLLEVGDGLPRLLLQILKHFHNITLKRNIYDRVSF